MAMTMAAPNPAAADPPPIGVTPIDTSAHSLKVTINIDEDQDATDHKSNISFQFSTTLVKESNYVIFDAGQNVTCNGVLLTLTNAPNYTLKVLQQEQAEPKAQPRYVCVYIGNTPNMGQLPAVQMFDIPARSMLSPQQPDVSGQGYKISYTADSSALACQITADAVDASHTVIHGPPSTSSLGTYVGPATSSLKGQGEIILKRTCSWTITGPFKSLSLTYQSTTSVEVTWTH
jgi:hypothetical protein